MTGGQDHAGTGRTLRGEGTNRVDFEQMVRACGVKWVRRVDSYDVARCTRPSARRSPFKGVSVVISDRPCVLDPVRIKGPPSRWPLEGCTACQSCMNLGCPALGWDEATVEGRHKVRIDAELCIGCSLCAQSCPSDCIRPAAAG